MSKRYAIQWKSNINGRVGRGTKLFEQEEAERLAQELNQEYPQIEHEAISMEAPEPAPTGSSETQPLLPSSVSAPAEEIPTPALDPVPAL